MNFELGKKYIVEVTEKGIIPTEEFLEERYIDKDHDDLEFLTDEEKTVIVNEVLDKIGNDIEQKCCITVGRENDPAITLYDVFQIIDKYKIPLDINKAKEFCGKDDCDKCKYLDGDLCRLVYQVKENLYEVMEDEV